MSTEVKVALITMIGVCITVFGSIVATNYVNKGQLEQQRIDAVREMKQTYYNQLIEATTTWQEYAQKPDSVEKAEAKMKFMEEANRVPLYASQEMVEFMEKIKDPKVAKDTSMTDFFIIMRADLCSDDFEDFSEIETVNMAISDIVVVKDSTGKQKIQK